MATPDMDIIKDVPGYKVILKAVLKSQIQQLVEQLASFTEEESVILTASVSDGTLSHLGSDSGKFFLEDHEDVKSQFLGFCLKRHHRKKQEKEQKEREQKEREEAMRTAAMRSQSRMGYMHRSPRMQSPRQPFARGSPGFSPRGPMRHEPYPSVRPKRTSLSFDMQGSANPSANSAVVKLEPQDDNTNDSDQNSNSQTPSIVKPEVEDDAASNSSTGVQQQDSSNTGDNADQSQTDTESGLAGIKVEAISEADMELEITGVEPGRPLVPQENWGPSTSVGIDQSGATGSPGDMQGYNNQNWTQSVSKYRDHAQVRQKASTKKTETYLEPLDRKNLPTCDYCGKVFAFKSKLSLHVKSHTGVKDFVCNVCGHGFIRSDKLRNHMLTVHKMSPGGEKSKK